MYWCSATHLRLIRSCMRHSRLDRASKETQLSLHIQYDKIDSKMSHSQESTVGHNRQTCKIIDKRSRFFNLRVTYLCGNISVRVPPKLPLRKTTSAKRLLPHIVAAQPETQWVMVELRPDGDRDARECDRFLHFLRTKNYCGVIDRMREGFAMFVLPSIGTGASTEENILIGLIVIKGRLSTNTIKVVCSHLKHKEFCILFIGETFDSACL